MKTELGLGETTHDSDPATDQTLAASSAPLVGAASAAAGEPKRGDSIGRFVVLGVLGSGGMGVVYSAFDPHLDRKVAIKLLASTVARSEAATIRMLREAQAMAKINHPNVIKVHEVGTYEEQIYLAIEFADDGTLRGWLREKHTQREILDVFAQAGRGLGAAHALGLVHRDFKPDNVLMSKNGAVQVTDFGLVSVANAVTRPPTEPLAPVDTSISQELTQTGSIMGTPTYMAPEQFKGEASTARTDQFSFCVALYEALYRMRPFAGANYAELLVSVTTGALSPAPPDAKVTTWVRRVLLRGLSIEPDKRYASMDELLAALAHDPARRRKRVLAWTGAGVLVAGGVAFALLRHHAPQCGSGDDHIAAVWNPVQRTKLGSAFATSNRPGAAATVTRVTELVDGWTGAWKLGYVGACRASQEGEQSAHVLDLRMQCLTRQLDEVRTTLDLLGGGGADVGEHGLDIVLELPSVEPCGDAAALTAAVPPPDAAVRDAVATAMKQVDHARTENHLGRYKASLDSARAAVVAARATHYTGAINRALALLAMIQALLSDPAAGATYKEAMQVAAEAGDTVGMLDALSGRLIELTRANHYEAAQELADLADALAKHAHLPDENLVQLDDAIARLLMKRGKPKEAQARYERTLAFARKVSPQSESVLLTLSQLGELYKDEGMLTEAAKTLEEGVAAAENHFGKNQPEVANLANDLGNVYRVQNRLEDAKRLYDRALAIRIASLGPDHADVGTSYNSLGSFYFDTGDVATAQSYYEKTLAVWEKVYGKDSVEIFPALLNLGQMLQGRGDPVGAKRLFERARILLEAAYGPDHPDVANAVWNLGLLAAGEHHYQEALALDQRALATFEKSEDPTDVAECTIDILDVVRELGKLDEAEALKKRATELVIKAYGADHTMMGKLLISSSKLEMKRRNYAAALDDSTRALAILEAKLGKDHPDVGTAALGVGRALTALNRSHEAVAFEERALAIDVATTQQPPVTAMARFGLAEALAHDKKTNARAITEAKAALAALDTHDVHDADAVEIRAWLRTHH